MFPQAKLCLLFVAGVFFFHFFFLKEKAYLLVDHQQTDRHTEEWTERIVRLQYHANITIALINELLRCFFLSV